MKPEELHLMIREGEGLTVEFKEKYSSKIDRDIVAFSNTKGGCILLGVADNKSISGETLTNKIKAEITDIARKCEPHIHIKKISQVEKIVVVEVEEGEEKPYSCSSGYFRRLDAVTQKMTQKEIHLLFKDMNIISFEERLNKDITFDGISKEKIKSFFKEAGIAIGGEISPHDVLSSLNLSKGLSVKNAGVLCFAKEPRRSILQCQMTLVAFKGTDRVNIYDRKDIQDDLMTQYKEAVVFLEKHLNVRSEIRGFSRTDIFDTPLEALREAVANAIIHRDYSMQGTSIMVEVHEDRVVVSNPGGLPEGISPRTLGKTTISVRRNELIADMFARMGKVERVGTGIQRMNDLMKKSGLPQPKIESDSFFIITFQRPPYILKGKEISREKGKEKTTEKILGVMTANPQVTIQEIALDLQLSTAGVEKVIRNLKKQKRLRRVGPDKGGHWEVAKD